MITSRHNPLLKDLRRLRHGKDRGKERVREQSEDRIADPGTPGRDGDGTNGSRAMLEGFHLVGEALDAGLELGPVLMTPELLTSSEGTALCRRLPRPPLAVAPALLDELADADSPHGLVAVARLPRATVDQLPRRPGGIYLFADGLQDPGNLGALARVAEAGGATALVLGPGCAHPNLPRALRASAGSLLRLAVARRVEAEALARHLDGLDPTWLALATRGGDDLYQATLEGTLVLLLGAEGPGLSPDLLRRAHRLVTIPLDPPVESLNATVAAAVVLFEYRRRQRVSG